MVKQMKKLTGFAVALLGAIGLSACGSGGDGKIPAAFAGLDRVAEDFTAFERAYAEEHAGEVAFSVDTLYKKLSADLKQLSPDLLTKTVTTECNPAGNLQIKAPLSVAEVVEKTGNFEVTLVATVETKDGEQLPHKLYFICYDADGETLQWGTCVKEEGHVEVTVKFPYHFRETEWNSDLRRAVEIPSPNRDRFMKLVRMDKIALVTESEYNAHWMDKNGCGPIAVGMPVDQIPQAVYGAYDKLEQKTREEVYEGGDSETVAYYEASLNGRPVLEINDYGMGKVYNIKVLSTNFWLRRRGITLDRTAAEFLSTHGENLTEDGVLFFAIGGAYFYGITLTESGWQKVSDAYLDGRRPFLTREDVDPLSRPEYAIIFGQ